MTILNAAKEDSNFEKALQEVELSMQQHGVRVWIGVGGLYVDVKGKKFMLKDVGSHDQVVSLPRSIDTERMILL